MDKEKINNDIVLETEKSDPELKKALSKSRKYLILAITVAVATLIIALVFFFSTVNTLLSDPIVRFASATQKTFTAYNATINGTIENTTTNGKAEINGSYEVDPDKKQFFAEFNITSRALTDKNSPETKINIIVNCETNGGNITYTKDNKTSDFKISENTANRFFNTFSDAGDMDIKNLNYDWAKLINEAGLQEYINSDEIENTLQSIYTALSSDEGRNLALGISETNENGEDIIHFELDPYRTANIILENGKPAFKRSQDYNKCQTFIEDYKSFLNNILIKCDVFISEDGFIKEISADNLGIKLNIKISDINSTRSKNTSNTQ